VTDRRLWVLAPAVLVVGLLWTALVVRWASGAEDHSVLRLIAGGGAALAVVAAYVVLRELRARRTLEEMAAEEHDRAALLQSRFHAAVYRAPVGVAVFDLDGKVEVVNDPVYDLLGIAPGTASDRVLDYFLPEDLDRVGGYIRQLARGEIERAEDDFQVRAPGDGPLRWVRVSSSSILGPDGSPVAIVAHVQDIEAERAAQEALRSRTRWFSSIVERSSDLILLFDESGMVTWASPSIKEIVGVGPEEVLGHPVRRFVVREDRPIVMDAMATAARTGSARVEFRVFTLHGDERWLETTVSNLLDDPDVAAMITISRDVTERHHATQRLAHQAAHDPLTGLLNRGELQVQMVRALGGLDTEPVALAFLDLDGFKAVNDEHGHLVGDELLKTVARCLEGEVRSGDLLARPGGDEFAVILRGSLPVALEVAERIRLRLREPMRLDRVDDLIRISASIGVAVAHPGDTVTSLLHAADLALYEAKRRGRDRVEVSTRSVQQAGREVDDLLDDVARGGDLSSGGRWSAEVVSEEPDGPVPG
jgi:diguanylate cyclase (GGDEF)-like protein/PAS domain S-box-containing protein